MSVLKLAMELQIIPKSQDFVDLNQLHGGQLLAQATKHQKRKHRSSHRQFHA